MGGVSWFTTAPPIDPEFTKTLDYQFLKGRYALVPYPESANGSSGDHYELITTWCHFAYTAFCLQWFAIG